MTRKRITTSQIIDLKSYLSKGNFMMILKYYYY